MKHLSIRVAWHENKWDGSVCSHPSQNTFCLQLPRIYEEKNDPEEEKIKDVYWDKLKSVNLPPCKAEGGAFMNTVKYKREFNHPYNKPGWRDDIPHLTLLPKTVEIPQYSSFAVPFWWMLRSNQKTIKEWYPDLPRDETPPFPSAWVYSNKTQEFLLKTFFEPIKENQSIAFFYVKGANPIDDDSRRLIVGIGTIKKKFPVFRYDTKSNYTYPIWDCLLTHGIRPGENETDGVLLPYHEYVQLPDDFALKTITGKKKKSDLIDEIKLTLAETATRQDFIEEFTYGTKWLKESSVLSLLEKLRKIVERIKEHGIVKGNWDGNLRWIDRQIGKVKESMGPFPSFANALIAFGFQYGNMLESDFQDQKLIGPKDDPWNTWENYIYGRIKLPKQVYSGEILQFRDLWLNESEERKNLLELLSRFELNDKQIRSWFDPIQRRKLGYSASDSEILENPYIISEEDMGDDTNFPISVETIDNGLFADKAIQGEHIPEPPQLIESPLDKRRIRAIIVNVLMAYAENGDTLLSINELIEALNTLKLKQPVIIPLNYIQTNIEFLKLKLEYFKTDDFDALQLKQYSDFEKYLGKVLLARSKKELEQVDEKWENLVINTVKSAGIKFDSKNQRHVTALKDQIDALKVITSRKLSVLHGPAGTGKTTVLGALFGCKELVKEGILLLAPTGKARVRLSKMSGSEAFTCAQFLNRLKRFDWARMKPRFTGSDKYREKQNVIIDECSMLTEDDLYAILQALDLGHIKRIILVGDPYQLPPIGPGRPFADFCSFLDNIKKDHSDYEASKCLARLKEVVRTVSGEKSDALTLASWYSGLKPLKNADEIFSKLNDNSKLNDLAVVCWQNEEELISRLSDVLVSELSLKDCNDYEKLNSFIGIEGKTINTDKIERFQILSPVKGPYWGSFNINRWFQQQFRRGFKQSANIGDFQIKPYDKVIQIVNEWREGYPAGEKHQLSNGQLGVIESIRSGFANVVFSGIQNNVSFGYKSQGYSDADANIELAWTITVHKSQGSDFDLVFLVLPKTGRILSRELIYTALTRAKKKLILLVEGEDPYWIINLSKPQYSETAKRNTQIFTPSIRDSRSALPYSEGLIHKTLKPGLIVRSKSEVIIANMLYQKGIEFEYERQYENQKGQKRLPDFTFIDAAGETIILEHLGMMSVPAYAADWEKKKFFYEKNGFVVNENLFVTTESESAGINSLEIEKTISQISTKL